MIATRRFVPWSLAILLASSLARAEEPDFERKYRAALELRARGDDAKALVIFQELEARSPTGRSIAQVALAEQAIGAWVRAEEDLLLALRRGGEWVSQNRAALEGALAFIQRHLGSLEIVCDGCAERLAARAFVDGTDAGALPLAPLRLELGQHRLEVRAPGHFDVVRVVEIAPGKLVREHVRLAPLPGSAEPSVAASVTPQVPPRSEAGHPATAAPPEGRSSTATILGVTALGAGALSLGAAVVLGLASNAAATDYNDDPSCSQPDKPSRCAALRDDVEDNRTFAVVAGITGAALVGAGVAIFVTTAPARTRVTLLPRSVSLTVRF